MGDIFDQVATGQKKDIFDEVAERRKAAAVPGSQPIDIKRFRTLYPEYNDIDDARLTKALHQKYYSDVPFETFAARFAGPTNDLGFIPDAVQPPQPDVSTRAGQLASRFSKQLYNRGIADVIKGTAYGLGGGRVMSTLAAPFVRARAAAAGKDISLSQAQQLMKAGMLERLDEVAPSAEVQPPKTLAEKIVDVGAGLTAMVTQLAVTRKVLPPGTREAMVWETQSLANGGTPGQGAALGAIFHGINKLPGRTLLGKAGKLALESGTMGGLTAIEGGTPEDIAIAAAVPAALKSVSAVAGIVRGQPDTPLPPLPRIAADPDQVYKAPVAPEKLPFVETEKPKPSTTSSRLAEPEGADSDDSYFLRYMWHTVRDSVPGKPVVPTPQAFLSALVNRHVALYQAFEKAKPGGPIQKQLSSDIYETTRTIDMLNGVTDPAEGRQFVPPEYQAAQAKQPSVLEPLAQVEKETEESARAFSEAQAKARAKRTQQEEADAWLENYRNQPVQTQTPATGAASAGETVPPAQEKPTAVTPQDQETQTVVQHSRETGKSVDAVADEYQRAQAQQTGETQPLTDHEMQVAKLVGIPGTNPPEETRKSLTLAGRLTPQELSGVRDAAGTPDALHKALQWASNSGDLPDDPVARETYLSNAKEAASRISKIEERPAGKNIVSRWQTADKMLDQVELAAGQPLRSIYHGMVEKSRRAKQRASDLVTGVLREVVDLKNYKLTGEENENIKQWLFRQDKSRWDALSPDGRRVALGLRSILQNYAADRIRAFRFYLWDKRGLVPSDIPKEDRERILAEGLDAKNKGTFDEWIAHQTWGTREVYYPAAGDDSGEIGVDDILKLPGLEAGGEGPGPGVGVRAAHAREGPGKEPAPGNVISTVINHVSRVDTALALKDDLPKFWGGFQKARPTDSDAEVMKEFINNIVGKTSHYRWIDRAVAKVFPWFWKLYFLNPLKNAWFFTRNLGQLAALGPAELRTGEAVKALSQIATDKAYGRVNEQRVRHFEEDFESRIRQDLSVYRHAMMMDENLADEFKGKFDTVVETMGKTAMWSEKANRIMTWSLSHQVAQTVTQALEAGKIGVAKARSRLMLDSMMLSQRAELDHLLTTGDYDTFVRRYAEYKTDAVNFSYDTALRSAWEQTPVGRAFAGIAVFPRGVYNIAVTNGLKPLVTGVKQGNYGQAAQGLRNIVMLYIGATATDWVYQQVTGRKGAYSVGGLLNYAPGAPGLNMLFQTCSDIGKATYRHSVGQTTTEQEAVEIAGILFKQAEFAFPLSDAIVRLYADSKNVEDVRLWGLVRVALDERYAQHAFKKNERSGYQAVMHLLFGGFNKAEKKPDERRIVR